MMSNLNTAYERSSRESGAPAYLRLRRVLREQVEQGAFGPGHTLPSERELAEELALSRVTVRKALAGLVEDGVLVQRRGAGTFVAERIVKPLSKMTSFTEDLRARGLNPRSVFLEKALGEVTPEEAMALNLSPGSLVARLHRLRYAGEEPLAVEQSAIPGSMLPDPGAVTDSLYAALERLELRPVRALQRLRAVNLGPAHSKLLQVAPGSAALAIERRSFLADGRLVEFTRSWYRGDAYDFVAELHGE
ncbi:MAG TPA: GntR family transcriptional regulator [Gammaproteobacteria bacterium]|nr:GntR family transcriptional regulator [Gammaproteobacteria bacterium]